MTTSQINAQQITGNIKVTDLKTGDFITTHNDTIYTYGAILQQALNPTATHKRCINYMYIEYADSANDIPAASSLIVNSLTNSNTYYTALDAAENGQHYIVVPITYASALEPTITNTSHKLGLSFVSMTVGELPANCIVYGGALVSRLDGANPEPIIWSRAYLDSNSRLPAGTTELAFQWTINFNTGTIS